MDRADKPYALIGHALFGCAVGIAVGYAIGVWSSDSRLGPPATQVSAVPVALKKPSEGAPKSSKPKRNQQDDDDDEEDDEDDDDDDDDDDDESGEDDDDDDDDDEDDDIDGRDYKMVCEASESCYKPLQYIRDARMCV
jgi:hypothetical protein